MQSFEHTPPEARELLPRRIRELGLRLEGSMLEKYVQQLYGELAAKGLSRFRPSVYLSDEWACPDKEPVIGVPFYLADPKIAGVGAFGDLGTHKLDILMWLIGDIDSVSAQVKVVTGRYGDCDESGDYDSPCA